MRLLHRQLCGYVFDPLSSRIMLDEENMVVVHILNGMVSASKQMMDVLRSLKVLKRVQRVSIEDRWVPLVVKKEAYFLPRT